jgi:ceramide glucosyltransferase
MSAVLLLCGAYLALLALKALLAWRVAARQPTPPADTDFSNVTILQPILGGDPRLAATLAANLAALPGARFVWLLDADDTAGHAAADEALAAQPSATVERVICPPPPDGVNPKLHKLALAVPHVTTPRLAVLDDDTTLPAATLAALLAALDRGAALATALPVCAHDRHLRSVLVGQFINNQSLLTYLPALAWQAPITINGMAYALDSAAWRARGGFGPLVRHLTDDLAVARAVRAAGGEIFQAGATVEVAVTVRDARHYARLMHRWFFFASLLLRGEPPAQRALILALHGLPPVLLWGVFIAAATAPSAKAAVALAGVIAGRAALLIAVQRVITGRARHAPLASILAELLQPLHLLHAQLDRTIHWRTRRYRVRSDTDFFPAAPLSPAPSRRCPRRPASPRHRVRGCKWRFSPGRCRARRRRSARSSAAFSPRCRAIRPSPAWAPIFPTMRAPRWPCGSAPRCGARACATSRPICAPARPASPPPMRRR